jgi:hypothetical protein
MTFGGVSSVLPHSVRLGRRRRFQQREAARRTELERNRIPDIIVSRMIGGLGGVLPCGRRARCWIGQRMTCSIE